MEQQVSSAERPAFAARRVRKLALCGPVTVGRRFGCAETSRARHQVGRARYARGIAPSRARGKELARGATRTCRWLRRRRRGAYAAAATSSDADANAATRVIGCGDARAECSAVVVAAAHGRAAELETARAQELTQARQPLRELVARARAVRDHLHVGLVVLQRDLHVERAELGRVQLDLRLADVVIDEPLDARRERVVPTRGVRVDRFAGALRKRRLRGRGARRRRMRCAVDACSERHRGRRDRARRPSSA